MRPLNIRCSLFLVKAIILNRMPPTGSFCLPSPTAMGRKVTNSLDGLRRHKSSMCSLQQEQNAPASWKIFSL